MFARFTHIDGLGARVRASRVLAFTEQEDGTTRLFLGYGLQLDIKESMDEVEAALAARPETD